MENSEQNAQLTGHDKAILNKIFNPNLPFNDVIEEDLKIDDENEIDTENVKQAKELEIEGVRAAEKGDITSSIEIFTHAIQVAPERASCYNNRAQSWQLMSNIPNALEDLNKAIELSRNRGKVSCQSYTQRGIIYRFKNDDELAIADFKMAASLGGEFAKQQMVAMNPYAAMCNQMLSEVMVKIKAGEA